MAHVLGDDAIWSALEAFEDESECWRVFNVDQGKRVFVARDRTRLPIHLGAPPMQEVAFERMDMKDVETAKRYIRWQALKAAIQAAVTNGNPHKEVGQ